jgi:hypothetical protein
MKVDLSKLPDDANLDKEAVVSLVGEIETSYQEKIHYLEEQIRLLKNELFGRKSEKRYPGPCDQQLPIIDSGLNDDQLFENQKPNDSIIVAAHQRKKRGRKPLPDDLPRVEIIHDLAEEQKICQCGASLSRIGVDTCEKLDYIPAKVQVERQMDETPLQVLKEPGRANTSKSYMWVFCGGRARSAYGAVSLSSHTQRQGVLRDGPLIRIVMQRCLSRSNRASTRDFF